MADAETPLPPLCVDCRHMVAMLGAFLCHRPVPVERCLVTGITSKPLGQPAFQQRQEGPDKCGVAGIYFEPEESPRG